MAGSVILQCLETLTTGRVVAAVFLFFLGAFVVDFTWKPRYPAQLPRIGYGDGVIGTVRNWMGYVLYFNDWVAEGYEKFSKQDKTFVVPSSASRPNEIVLPRSQTMWLLEMPDRVVSTLEAHDDVLFNTYQFLGVGSGYPISVLHKHLARNLPGLIPGIQEEVHGVLDEIFGTDTEGEWKELNLWDAWLGIVPRVTNRVLVGAEVCRNKEFLRRVVTFADQVVMNSFILSMTPKILHPIMGRLVTLRNWWTWWKLSRIALPTMRERLRDMMRKHSGEPGYENWAPKEDFITWVIRQSIVDGKPAELDADMISKRLLPLEFAAIHTTVITGHSLLLDLFSSDPKFVEEIKEETSRVFREEGGRWTKEGLSRLYKTDSAIRESQRLSNFATSLVKRKVIAPEGIINQAEGWHAPYGALCMLNLAGVQHDADIYSDPYQYDAFRYSRVRIEYAGRPREKRDKEEGLRVAKLGMVTTSDSHLAFGHGRHACPGRFFVAHELKMVLAYLLNNYEIKPIAERPKPQWLGQTIIPALQAKIVARRRKATA
ncbi:cytochrome P450 [Coniochaeta sp. 2T2.1]|nr:cytochrome P450 [Coniochaeta sp. 2T2.1]